MNKCARCTRKARKCFQKLMQISVPIEDLGIQKFPSRFLLQEDKHADRKRTKVSKACTRCRKAHVSCNEERPCQRCVSRGQPQLCVDSAIVRKLQRPPELQANSTWHPGFDDFMLSDLAVRAEKVPSTTSTDFDFASHNFPFAGAYTPTSSTPSIEQATHTEPSMNQIPINGYYPDILRTAGIMGPAASRDCSNSGFPKLAHQPMDYINADMDCSTLNSERHMLLPPPPMNKNQVYMNSKPPAAVAHNIMLVNDHRLENLKCKVAPRDSQFMSLAPLRQVLAQKTQQASVVGHIEYQISLLKPKSTPGHQATLVLVNFITFFECMVPSTPSAIFSPSGLIFTCNAAFSDLVQMSSLELLCGDCCIFTFFDVSSILTILEMANRSQERGVGRCSIKSAHNAHRLCAASISTHDELDMLWIVAQFIPI